MKNNLKLAERGALVSIWAYVILSGLKIAVANLSGSEALRADGFNNVTDIIGNITILIGLKIARRPADEDHTYGHWKVETVASLIASFIMALVGFDVLKDAILAMLHPSLEHMDPWSAAVGILSAFVMLGVYRYNILLSKQTGSRALMAAAKDNLSDALTSLSTVVAIVAAYFGWVLLDRLMALLITGFIFKTAYDIFIESTFALSDGFSEEKLADYQAIVEASDPRLRVKSIRGRSYGSREFLDIVIELSADMSVYESHAITEVVERELKAQKDVEDADIHVEPALVPEEAQDSYIGLYLLGLEEQVLNQEAKPSLFASEFVALGQPLDLKTGKIGLNDYNAHRLSKKTVLITYTYTIDQVQYQVLSVWRRHHQWQVVRRMVAKL